jgi:hypothetical protein
MNVETLDEVAIPLSRTKIVVMIVGAVGFVVLSVWIWSLADAQPRFHPHFLRGVAAAGVGFFGLCAAYGCLKFFDCKPGLVIDREGIIDNSSAVAVGRIPWEHVVGFRVGEVYGQRILTIDVVDPQLYAGRGKAFQRLLHAANLRMTGSPINIASGALRADMDELIEVLTAAMERRQNAAS